MKLIYDYFDYEDNYAPDFMGDRQEALILVDYLKNKGYTYIQKKDKSIFKKDNRTFVGVGETEAEAITKAFATYLRSFKCEK